MSPRRRQVRIVVVFRQCANSSRSIPRARKRESQIAAVSGSVYAPSLHTLTHGILTVHTRKPRGFLPSLATLTSLRSWRFPRRSACDRAQRANSRNSTLQPPIHSRYFAVSGDSSHRRTDFSQSALAIAFANNARTFAFMAIPTPLHSISKRAAQSSLLKIGRRHAAAHWRESQFSHAA